MGLHIFVNNGISIFVNYKFNKYISFVNVLRKEWFYLVGCHLSLRNLLLAFFLAPDVHNLNTVQDKFWAKISKS